MKPFALLYTLSFLAALVRAVIQPGTTPNPSQIYSGSHVNNITKLRYNPNDQNFYSVGVDGYVVRWAFGNGASLAIEKFLYSGFFYDVDFWGTFIFLSASTKSIERKDYVGGVYSANSTLFLYNYEWNVPSRHFSICNNDTLIGGTNAAVIRVPSPSLGDISAQDYILFAPNTYSTCSSCTSSLVYVGLSNGTIFSASIFSNFMTSAVTAADCNTNPSSVTVIKYFRDQVFAGYDLGTICQYQASTMTLIQGATSYAATSISAIELFDGTDGVSYMVVGASDGTLKQYRLSDGAMVWSYGGHTSYLGTALVNGSRILSGGNDGGSYNIKEWPISNLVDVPATTTTVTVQG